MLLEYEFWLSFRRNCNSMSVSNRMGGTQFDIWRQMSSNDIQSLDAQCSNVTLTKTSPLFTLFSAYSRPFCCLVQPQGDFVRFQSIVMKNIGFLSNRKQGCLRNLIYLTKRRRYSVYYCYFVSGFSFQRNESLLFQT